MAKPNLKIGESDDGTLGYTGSGLALYPPIPDSYPPLTELERNELLEVMRKDEVIFAARANYISSMIALSEFGSHSVSFLELWVNIKKSIYNGNYRPISFNVGAPPTIDRLIKYEPWQVESFIRRLCRLPDDFISTSRELIESSTVKTMFSAALQSLCKDAPVPYSKLLSFLESKLDLSEISQKRYRRANPDDIHIVVHSGNKYKKGYVWFCTFFLMAITKETARKIQAGELSEVPYNGELDIGERYIGLDEKEVFSGLLINDEDSSLDVITRSGLTSANLQSGKISEWTDYCQQLKNIGVQEVSWREKLEYAKLCVRYSPHDLTLFELVDGQEIFKFIDFNLLSATIFSKTVGKPNIGSLEDHNTYLGVSETLREKLADIDHFAAQNPGKPLGLKILEVFPDLHSDLNGLVAEGDNRTSFPEVAPLLWATDKLPGETPAEFILRVYGRWNGGALNKGILRDRDSQLMRALYNWQARGNTIPEELDLPTKSQAYDRLAEQTKAVGEAAKSVGDMVLGPFSLKEARRVEAALSRRKSRE